MRSYRQSHTEVELLCNYLQYFCADFPFPARKLHVDGVALRTIEILVSEISMPIVNCKIVNCMDLFLYNLSVTMMLNAPEAMNKR